MKMKLLDYENSRLRTYYHQWLTAAGAAVILMEIGFFFGWASPYLARLTAANSPLPLTSSEASWVASLFGFGTFVGAFLAVPLMNFCGSKNTIIISILPICGCWICIICATNAIWLYFGRFSGGVGMEMISNCMLIFGTEIALPEIRGAIVTAVDVGGFSIGILVSSIVGPYMSMRLSAIMYLLPCIVVLIFFTWLPETPQWLVKNNDDEVAKRSIMWYQPICDPEIELSAMKKIPFTSTFGEKIRKCFKPGPVRRAFIIIIVFSTLINLTGIQCLSFYMETILIRSKLTIVKPSNLVIYVHVSCVAISILSMCLIDRCGRKFLLIISSAGMTISLLILGINSYLVKENVDISKLQWLPIVSLFMFLDFYYIGLLSVPYTVIGEICPSDVNYLIVFVSNLSGSASTFVTLKSFQPTIDLIGECYVFWILAALTFLIVPFTHFCLPETKGKSLQQIQEEMMH